MDDEDPCKVKRQEAGRFKGYGIIPAGNGDGHPKQRHGLTQRRRWGNNSDLAVNRN